MVYLFFWRSLSISTKRRTAEAATMSSLQVQKERKSYTRALLRSLRHAGVKFLRFQAVDPFHTVRMKAVPLDYLLLHSNDDDNDDSSLLDHQVAMAQVVFGGLPTFGDVIQPASGLDASRLVQLVPDVGSLRILPHTTAAAVQCALHDPTTRQPSPLCCRSLLARVVQEARATHNIAFNVGSELEFCLFHNKGPNTQHQPVDETNFATLQLLNEQQDFIEKIHGALTALDIVVEQIHAESAPGQVEVVLRYCHNDPVEMADRLILARETISSTAKSMGLLALWLPKIFASKAGNGNHLHLSLCNATTGANLFAATWAANNDTRRPLAQPSADDIHPTARCFIEGILSHLPSLMALTLPTLNSFRRIGPGCWTGAAITWGFDDKESPLRVTADHRTGTWRSVEYKFMDSTANPHLAMAAILTAGLDGIARQATLRPVDAVGTTSPSSLLSLAECLDALQNNDLLTSKLSPQLMRAYLAGRRGEVEHARDRTLDDEVAEALRLA